MNIKRLQIFAMTLWLAACAAPGLTVVERDSQARERWQQAARNGDADAQFELGNSYCCGEGFYDTATAIRWWCRAAAQGHDRASEALRKHDSATSCATPAEDTLTLSTKSSQ